MTEELPGRITDPRALRALSHPTRWKLIELLGLERIATATRCAEFTGESVASCSYHLGILAKYGFIEPVEGNHGREKPWRATSRRLSVSSQGLEPEAALAAETVAEVFLDHEVGRMKEYQRRSSREPAEWQNRLGTESGLSWLTPDELAELTATVRARMERYSPRVEDPALRPPGARPVRVVLASYLPLPPESNPSAPTTHYSEEHQDEEGP